MRRREKLFARATLASLVLLSVPLACDLGDEDPCPIPCSRETPMVAPPSPSSVSDTIVTEHNRFFLTAYVWENMAPVTVPDPCSRNHGSLTANVQLVDADSAAVPTDVDLDHLWVLWEDSWWSAEFTSETGPSTQSFRLDRIARCGPTWPPYSAVDVIARVLIGSDEPRYVRRADVVIEAPE